MQSERPNLLGMPREELEQFFAGLNERSFRAAQVLKWIHQQRADRFDTMTNLSKSLRERLERLAKIEVPRVRGHQVSADGTHKWLVSADGNNSIETVFIPEPERGTLCVSSQVGCALNCRFCATAVQGFNRNLSAGEIIGQLWLASHWLEKSSTQAITNVVMMGMGEPLLNFESVVSAMEIMLEDNAYGLARRRVTLSTAGMVPAIRRLKETCPVSLAVSLHAPNDPLRDELVPLNRTYPIALLLDACRDYVQASPESQGHFRICDAGGGQRFTTSREATGQAASGYSRQGKSHPLQLIPRGGLPLLVSGHDRRFPEDSRGCGFDCHNPQDPRGRHRCRVWTAGRSSCTSGSSSRVTPGVGRSTANHRKSTGYNRTIQLTDKRILDKSAIWRMILIRYWK